MAVQVSDSGDMEVRLGVKDEGSAVVEKFAENAEKALGGASEKLDLGQQRRLLGLKDEGSLAGAAASGYENLGKGIAATAIAIGTIAAGVATYGLRIGAALDKQSEKLGISVEWLQKAQVAASLIDSEDKLGTWVRNMESNLAKAVETGKGVTGVLSDIGISAEDLKKAGPEKAFDAIVTALDRMPDPMERTRLAMAIFGRGADDAARMGSAMRDAADHVGKMTTITGEAAAASNKFWDQQTLLLDVLKDIPRIVTNDVAKPFAEMAKIFKDFVENSGFVKAAGKGLSIVLSGLGSIVVLLGTGIGMTGKLMGGFAAVFGELLQGHWKGALEAGKAMGQDLGETLDKFKELQSQLLGLKGRQSGGQKMAFPGADAADTWSDVLPGKKLNMSTNTKRGAKNDAEFEAQRTHYDRMTELHTSWQITLSGIDEEEVKRRREFWKSDTAYKLAVTESFFSSMAGLMESKSKTIFKIGQAFAIADTIMQTYRAAMGAYAAFAWIPYVGPALGIAAAAAAIAVGMARVQAIRNLSVGGGAAAPVFNASPTTGIPAAPAAANQSDFNTTAAAPAPATARPSAQRNLTLVGDVFSAELVRDTLIPMLNDASRDGVHINVRYAAA